MKNSKVIPILLFTFCVILCGCANKPQEDSTQIKKSVTAVAESTTKSSSKVKIICPKCGKVGVPIVYGKPGRKTMEKAEEKKVYLGGCVVRKDVPNPKYHCYHCGNNWGTKN